MSTSPRSSLGSKQRQRRLLISLSGIGLTILALIGMWRLTPHPENHQQGKYLHIKAGETFRFDIGFAVTPVGNLQNEGTIYFDGNITNFGRFGCGTCQSGTNVLRKSGKGPQFIRGNAPIHMYELVLDREGAIILENNIHIKKRLIFGDALIKGDKEGADSYIHFDHGAATENASQFSHINGWVARTGKGSFRFPIGDGSQLKAIYLSGKNDNSFFQATYLSSEELKKLETFIRQQMYLPQNKLTYLEKGSWLIQGSEPTHIIIEESFSQKEDHNNLVVLGRKGGKWLSLGGERTTHGIGTNKAIIPDDYEMFSLAKQEISPLTRR